MCLHRNSFSLWCILLLPLLMVGCAEDEPREVNRIPIAFSLQSNHQPLVKAGAVFVDGTTKTTIPAGEFVGVFGYYQQTSTWNTWQPGKGKADIFYNEKMTSQGAGTDPEKAGLTYVNTRYWPNNAGDKCAFLAYYPYSANGVTTHGVKVNAGSTDMASFHFKMESKSSNQVDFMISDFVANMEKPVLTTSVELNLHHVLCQVKINVEKLYNIEDVTNIQLTGIQMEGDCTPSMTTEGTAYTWSNTTKGDVTVDNFNAPQSIILAIPHSVTGAKVKVTAKGKTDEYELQDMVWKAGCRYEIILGGGLDVIGVEVRGWKLFESETPMAAGYEIKESVLSTEAKNAVQSVLDNGRTPLLAFYYYNNDNQSYFQFSVISRNYKIDGVVSDGKGGKKTTDYRTGTAYFVPMDQQMWDYMLNTAGYWAFDKTVLLKFPQIVNANIIAVTILTSDEDLAAAEAEVLSGAAVKGTLY